MGAARLQVPTLPTLRNEIFPQYFSFPRMIILSKPNQRPEAQNPAYRFRPAV